MDGPVRNTQPRDSRTLALRSLETDSLRRLFHAVLRRLRRVSSQSRSGIYISQDVCANSECIIVRHRPVVDEEKLRKCATHLS